MTEHWITLICAVLGSGGFTALVTYLLTARKDRKKEAQKNEWRVQAVIDAVMMLALSDLQTRCRTIIAAKGRTALETKQLFKLRTVYKALGGDGWADDLFYCAMKQPILELEVEDN